MTFSLNQPLPLHKRLVYHSSHPTLYVLFLITFTNTSTERLGWIGFKITVGLEEGLTQFCNWVKGQEHDNSGYEKSLSEMEKAGMFIRK